MKKKLIFFKKKKYNFRKQYYGVGSVKRNRAAMLTKLHQHYNVGAPKLTRSTLFKSGQIRPPAAASCVAFRRHSKFSI